MSVHQLSNSFLLLLSITIISFTLNPYLSYGQNKTLNRTSSNNQDFEIIKQYKNAPQDVRKKGKIPVMIVYEDKDSLGRRLIFTLRERFNTSEIFRLSGYNEKKIKIIVSTKEEFQSRPNLCSIYSIVWSFSYEQDLLSNYLTNKVGIINSKSLKELAESLVAQTDKIYLQYSYLFEEQSQ
ncbi:MAG TPA: hypothetical protein VKN82_05885 [Desulfohalobiaceae bacterium]|nr:hypothetical protein [Desulfohalobiaceae bacterium]